MKLTIERSALLRSLAHVQSVVERRNTIPILSNVQIVAGEDSVHLTATDLDLAVVEAVGCEISQQGGTTAPAHMLYDIARKLPDGAQVEFDYSSEDARLSVRAGRSRFALSCLPREDFPTMAEDNLPHRFRVPAAELKRLIEKTRFAISTEETRYYLNGIYLHAVEDGGGQLRAVATDGHRLARVEIPLPDGAAGMPGIIVPRKTVQEVYKLLEDVDAEVDIALSEARIQFAFGSLILTSKLIDGTFPDYQRVIPQGNDRRLEVDCKVFADAVDRVATISSEKSRAVKLAASADAMVISASNPEQGSGTDEVAIAFDDAGALEIGFNARYLLDITQQIEGDTMRFDLQDSASPTIIRDPGDDAALYVLMPMRV